MRKNPPFPTKGRQSSPPCFLAMLGGVQKPPLRLWRRQSPFTKGVIDLLFFFVSKYNVVAYPTLHGVADGVFHGEDGGGL